MSFTPARNYCKSVLVKQACVAVDEDYLSIGGLEEFAERKTLKCSFHRSYALPGGQIVADSTISQNI